MKKQNETVEEVQIETEQTEQKTGKDKVDPPAFDNKRLMSLGEYAANTDRKDITEVLQAGFRVWMKTAKQQSLRSRTVAQWDKLFDQYLKS